MFTVKYMAACLTISFAARQVRAAIESNYRKHSSAIIVLLLYFVNNIVTYIVFDMQNPMVYTVISQKDIYFCKSLN
jgi:hypothetical protein